MHPPPQVFVLALTFLVLFLGNFLTTLKVVHTKLQQTRSKAKKPGAAGPVPLETPDF